MSNPVVTRMQATFENKFLQLNNGATLLNEFNLLFSTGSIKNNYEQSLDISEGEVDEGGLKIPV